MYFCVIVIGGSGHKTSPVYLENGEMAAVQYFFSKKMHGEYSECLFLISAFPDSQNHVPKIILEFHVENWLLHSLSKGAQLTGM